MKSILLSIVMTAMTVTASAQISGDSEADALQALIAANPKMTLGYRDDVPLSVVLANSMVSRFSKGEDGALRGSLAVTTNSCKINEDNKSLNCRLNILDSDRIKDAEGAYQPAPGMTESAVTIFYTYDPISGAISEVSFFLAG